MSVVLGLPKKLLPSPEASLSEGCTSQIVKIQPNNVASVVSGTTNLVASSYLNQMAFPSQEVRFSLPCSMGRNVWLDTSKSTLSFRVRYEVSTTSVGSTELISGGLVSNALSWFDRIQCINSNGTAVEDVVGLSQAENHKQIFAFDAAERDSIALAYGYRFEGDTANSQNKTTGHLISSFLATGAGQISGSSYYSYEVPLPSSLLGPMCKSFIPIGSLSQLNCYLTTASIQPVVIQVGAGVSAGAVRCTLDNFSINCSYLTLDDRSAALLGSPKTFYAHGITNRVSSATLNSGITGAVSVLCGIRGQSVRSLSARFSESNYTTAGAVNGIFDSKMPLGTLNWFLQGSVRVPPNPASTGTAPASLFTQALQASEAFTERAMKYGAVSTGFTSYLATGAPPTAANGFDQNVVNAGSTTTMDSLRCFSFSCDLRKASTSTIMDGINMSSSANNYLEMNITNAPTYNTYVTFISSQDVIYLIDMQTGNLDFRL